MKKIASSINWQKSGDLVPTIVQNAQTGSVLMLGYMNREALQKTIKTGTVWFFSRSKNRLWMKGETSKNILEVRDITVDRDGDALLIKAEPAGPTCHTNALSCFGKNEADFDPIFRELFSIIQERKKKMPKKSYTAELFRKGLNAMCAKIAEESDEVIQAAKKETRRRLIEESADVLYHLAVLLVERDITLPDIAKELKRRRKS